MLKGLKVLGIITKKETNPSVILLFIIAAELLALGWLTWLVFHKNPIN